MSLYVLIADGDEEQAGVDAYEREQERAEREAERRENGR